MVSRVKKSRHERLGRRYGKVWLVALAGVMLLGVGLGWWRLNSRPSALSRQNLLLVGDPMLVWSWDRHSGKSVFIQIPASVQIEGLFGYGKYSLASLSQLGKL